MDPVTIRAFEMMLGGTNMAVDNKRNVMALRSCRNDDERAVVLKMIVEKRKEWQKWLTLGQRKWQSRQRIVSERTCANRRARWGNRHDAFTILRAENESVQTREKYVRCAI